MLSAPDVELCPGGLATADAQWEVAPSSASTVIGWRRDGPSYGRRNAMSDETFAWFVGVDWGSEKHQVVFSISKGLSGESGTSHIVVRVWQSWATGCCHRG